MLKFIIKTVRL